MSKSYASEDVSCSSEDVSCSSAGPDPTAVNTSATNCYIKRVYVAGKPIIITSNDPPPLENLWIKANAFILFIEESTWVQSG